MLDIGETPGGLHVTIYRGKIWTMQEGRGTVRPGPSAVLVRAVKTWIDILATRGRHSQPLFVRINRHDQLAPMLTRNGARIGRPRR